jgi:PhnB protein
MLLSAYPYILVDNVKETVEYYQSKIGGEVKVLNQQDGKYLHAELLLGNSPLHFSDTYGKQPTSENNKIMLQFGSEDELRKVYDALKEDGEVVIELQDTFFGALHGQVMDNKNKITWVMNCFKKK